MIWTSYTGNVINRTVGREGRLWQAEPYDHIVRTRTERERIRQYIRENPAKARVSSFLGSWAEHT